MGEYSSFSDDYYINLHLHTEMDLPQNRETVLHFFEQLRRQYPSMHNFYGRDRGDYVLEEDKDSGTYRWVTLEPRRVCSGMVNPPSVREAEAQHAFVLDHVPHALSISPIDCESLNVMFGFDFTYRGDHNQLIAEALGITPAFERLTEVTQGRIVNHDPSIHVALDRDCRTQCRLSIEPRTTAYQIRTGDYPDEQLSVYLTARRFGTLESHKTFVQTLRELTDICCEIIDRFLIDEVLRPLQSTIATK
ncbi:MAG TPA: hypothetical protein ENJ50_08460 [Planctomycetaceae bacterium]|nr:hypothetical protein [Planctomycetaceae bacterium]